MAEPDWDWGRDPEAPFTPPPRLLMLPCLDGGAENWLISFSNAIHFSSGRLGFFRDSK